MRPRIIVSNGFGRFPMRLTAVEAARREALAAFITGGYPTPGLARWIEAIGLSRVAAVGRFLARAEPVPLDCVHALWAGEPFSQLGNYARGRRILAGEFVDRIQLLACRLYAIEASRIVKRIGQAHGRGIYHYRAGFGGGSVEAARRRGWICLCEHTIAHPAVLEYLVTNARRLPPAGESGPISRSWRAILADIERADHVVVESDFVKSTFIHQGWSTGEIDVIYRGVEDSFLSALPERESHDGPLRLLFSGSFDRRKGGPDLAEAMQRLDDVDWRLDLAGPISSESAKVLARLTADPRVIHHGVLSITDLAALMAAADVFVFPTRAEGSARVLSEALAAGCYVITTPNGGPIMADGEHGELIAPGGVQGIVDALLRAAGDRSRVARIGARNAAFMRRGWGQADYGARLFELYARLLQRRLATRRRPEADSAHPPAASARYGA